MSKSKSDDKYNFTQYLDRTMGKEGLLNDLEEGLKYSNERVADVDAELALLKDKRARGRNARELADIFWYWAEKRATAEKQEKKTDETVQESSEEEVDIIDILETKEKWYAECSKWKVSEWHAYVAKHWHKIPDQFTLMYAGLYQKLTEHAYKTNSDYMERLVFRWGDEDFANESTLRLKILKQFVKHSDWKTEELMEEAQKLYQLEHLTGDELKLTLLNQMEDNVFELLAEVKLTAAELAEIILETSEDNWLQAEVKEPEKLFEMVEGYNQAWTTKEKLRFIVQLQAEKDSAEDEVLRTYAETVVKAVKKPLETTAKERIDGKIRYAKEKKNKEHTLLKTADRLAKGLFVKNYPTKEMLYRFAVVFGLNPSEVEKDLFHDYYSDSLFKYFTEDYNRFAGNVEEPQGDGIDYKNYMEVCFIYALQKELTPNEKMKLADKLIQEIQATPKRNKKAVKEAVLEKETRYYKEDIETAISSMSEEEFISFIRETYYIPSGKKHVMKNVTGQKHAQLVYDHIVNSLIETYGTKKNLEKEFFGELRFYPPKDDIEYALGNKAKKEKTEESEEDSFNTIMENMAEKMLRLDSRSPAYREEEERLQKEVEAKKITKAEKKKKLELFAGNEGRTFGDKQIKQGYTTLWDEDGPVTRTKLLAAMFFHYLILNTFLPEEGAYVCQSRSEQKQNVVSYGDMFKKLSSQVNPVLEECRYQKISAKNLFDIMLVLLLANSHKEFGK